MFSPFAKSRKEKPSPPSHRAQRRNGVSHVPLIRTFW